jgi:hypothetical protein
MRQGCHARIIEPYGGPNRTEIALFLPARGSRALLLPSYCRRKAITFLDLLRLSPFFIDNLFLNYACKSSSAISALKAQKGKPCKTEA